MLTVRIYDEKHGHPKYVVQVTRQCRVECPKCKWKGTRRVHFIEGVNERHTADEMQARILGREDRPNNCPECEESCVKFVGVPRAKKVAVHDAT